MADRGARNQAVTARRPRSSGRPSATSTRVLWALLVLCLGLTLAFAVGPFLTTTATVEPAQVPAGRIMWTTVERGASRSFVECPGALWSSQGHDRLCRGPARRQVMAQLIGLVLFVAFDAVLVALIRTRRRRRSAVGPDHQGETGDQATTGPSRWRVPRAARA